ncbi:MAG: prephenate dehydrogenase [Bacteroidales bacterium]|jgi:prephenate dehydrogenase|nr:prephenate dehydrogenase [Bacteroidales bacterium]MBR6932219.1 prephenate dehydrogenase [Bacteroidales bacterium]
MTLGIIGLGLIGGSMAIDLKRRGFADRVIGVEDDPVSASAAEKIGLVDAVVPFGTCIEEADLVIVAVPVGTAVKMVPEILDRFQAAGAKDKIVIDVCSTKEQITLATHYHPCRGQFVSTHPMAGTEYSGPWAAMPNLFDGRACIFANSEESSPKALATVERLYDTLNMRPIFMNASNHDVHTAYVSHISHVTSFALALTVLDKERDEKHIFDLASGGFSSTVRLAKSNADMWVPILTQNRENVLKVIDTYIEKMTQFRDAIDSYDEEKIRSLIEESNRIKKIIR